MQTMILLYSRVQGDHLTDHVRAVAEAHFAVDVVESMATLPALGDSAWCILMTMADWVSLSGAEQTNVSLPRVYVTPSSHVPESRGASNGEAYVRMTRLQRDLKGEILRLRVRWAQGRLRMTAEQRVELPILARRAIDVAARTRPPIRTVSELASRLTCSRSALWKAWKGNRAREARLEDFTRLASVSGIHLAQGVGPEHGRHFGPSSRTRAHYRSYCRTADGTHS